MTGRTATLPSIVAALCVVVGGAILPGSIKAQTTIAIHPLDVLLEANWVDTDWVGSLLRHVDQNRDPSLPLSAPDGWRAALRQAVYDCWTRTYRNEMLPAPREYNECFDAEAQLSSRMHDVAWVLVRHEWESYRGTLDPAQRRAAAWHLDQAISEYKAMVSGVELRSVEPQSTSLKRLRVISGFTDEISADLGVDSPSVIVRRQQVRDEINRQLRLDGSGAGDLDNNVFVSIVGPLQELTRDAITTYLTAVEASLDAQALAVLVYGDGEQGGVSGDGNLSAYLNCNSSAAVGGCEASSERAVLSLSELANTRELRPLYTFARDAVLERPNAIGLAERYARMKQALYPNVPQVAAAIHADQIWVRWFDETGTQATTLEALMRGEDALLRPPEEDEDGALPVSLETACRAWADFGNGSGGRCPFRALAARALPDVTAPDTFGLRAREAAILSLLDRVRANTDNAALQNLITDLMAETEALRSDDQTQITSSNIALPYLADDRPTELTEYTRALCASNSASVFQANHCVLRLLGDETTAVGVGLLHDRLRRLTNQTAPRTRYEEKLDGLYALLGDLNSNLHEELIQNGVLRAPQPGTAPARAAQGSLVEQVCLQASSFLPAMQAAGMREVVLSTGRSITFGGGLCQ